MWIYILWNRAYSCPLGFVYGIPTGDKSFEVYGSYVDSYFRRKGVRTFLNIEIQKRFPIITTATGSKDGGRQFMKARGYEFEPKTNKWFVCKSERKQKPNAKR